MLTYLDVLIIIIVNAFNDIFLMVIVGPKITARLANSEKYQSKMANAVKSAILDDLDFIDRTMGAIVDSPSTNDGIERFRQKIMGTISGFENAEEHGMAVKALRKDVIEDIEENNPQISAFLEYFPNVKKRLEKNPGLLPVAWKMLSQFIDLE